MPTKKRQRRSWPLAGITLGLADAALMIEKSETHVLRLVKDGLLQKAGRGQYRPEDIARAALLFREGEDRRSSQTEEAKRVAVARAKEIELRTAREEARLVPLEDVQALVADVLGTYRSELEGVAAGSTRDLSIRAAIQQQIDDAMDRCHARFERAERALSEGRDPLEDGE
ncbi:hypothetical protein ACVWZR_004582 [Bradyrhizobium sp. i1.3.1]